VEIKSYYQSINNKNNSGEEYNMDNNILKNLPKSLIDSVQSIMDSTKPVETKHVQALNENLVGNQHKIDANKNGEIDAHDFKLLRRKKAVKKALNSGVKVEDLIQFNSPMQPDLHEEVGVVVHRDNRDGTIHVVVEGMKYKLKKGQVKEVSEELLDENNYKTAQTSYAKGSKEEEQAKKKDKMVANVLFGKKKTNEEVEQIDEVSKETMLSYKKGAEVAATRKPGKPSKAVTALRVKRGKGLEMVKSKLQDIYRKESEARMAERQKVNNDLDAHFDKNHHAILEKHGFKLMSTGETPEHEVKTYIHAHKNGHATMISIQKKKGSDSLYGGYRHEIRAVNTKGTSWSSHHPNTGFNVDGEEHKAQMMPKFENHVIDVKNTGAQDSRW
jgi:hypothetical protein